MWKKTLLCMILKKKVTEMSWLIYVLATWYKLITLSPNNFGINYWPNTRCIRKTYADRDRVGNWTVGTDFLWCVCISFKQIKSNLWDTSQFVERSHFQLRQIYILLNRVIFFTFSFKKHCKNNAIFKS